MKSRAWLQGLRFAWQGLRFAFQREKHFQLEVVCALLVLVCLAVFPLSAVERAVLIIVTLIVLVLELVNTSVERIIDLIKPRLSESARDVKDLMAGAVLLSTFFALLVGLIILGPYFLSLIRSL